MKQPFKEESQDKQNQFIKEEHNKKPLPILRKNKKHEIKH